ncbi:pyridoxamine 5'-phosphate oxidase family protein [Roseomonas populi]|uniref:Pyridoxamine 5'-phosphate oxidase family protein n=1 Tax=Roseomonas populi TaxID=3121582 RepID=A0ABT1XA42_9PROT|nr:pyridoxamine 5'-phosphate oxidase family protein [Roseomonas pecuniae]MCR0984579.1 pyridoxamine 5'-phosphate oxidase family protein [Roseomonas pecuniae]
MALQQAAGAREHLEAIGRHIIRDHMPEQHRLFFAGLPFVVIGVVDPAGQPWATLRAGRVGFMSAPDPRHLRIELPRDAADPADAGMEDGDAVGLLGIDLATRRRNRLNGTLRRDWSGGFTVVVGQSFGNCPQYIQQREARFLRDPLSASADPPLVTVGLDERARRIIGHADTFYVATSADLADGQRQIDVSHRGGRPGFVRIGDDGALTIPDFAGNRFFNTLGNLLVNARAGLVFVEDKTGSLLQMTGKAEVLADTSGITAFPGAQRIWRFKPQQVVFRAAGLPLALSPLPDGWSPQTLRTGSWT